MELVVFYYLYLSIFSVFPPFGCPMVPLSLFFFFCPPPFLGVPPNMVGFINVNIDKYLQRYFNIETGTLFV